MIQNKMRIYNKIYYMSPNHLFIPLIAIFFVSFSFSVTGADHMTKENTTPKKNTNRVSSLLVFGDSTVDPGNNNYINTILKSDFPPYGQDFKNHIPTGRFTNGKLPTDFIASYLGLKEYVPPYLDPSLSINDLLTGVSFASAVSGFDPLTPTLSNVIGLPAQLEYFREYKRRIQGEIGKNRMKIHIKEAVYLLSAGTNDFVVNYFTLPIRSKSYSIPAYERFILSYVKQFLQGLWHEGARKIAIVGLPPLGCLPIMITLHSNDPINERDCIDTYSSVARDYNSILRNEINSMQETLAHLGSSIRYIDVYDVIIDVIAQYAKYGPEYVNSGCCGTGFLETSFLCNPKSYICEDVSKYIFFDSVHPTEKTYYKTFRGGQPIWDSFINF